MRLENGGLSPAPRPDRGLLCVMTSHSLSYISPGLGAKWSVCAVRVPSRVLVRSDYNEHFVRRWRCSTERSNATTADVNNQHKRHEASLMQKLLNAISIPQCWVNYGGLRHPSNNEFLVHIKGWALCMTQRCFSGLIVSLVWKAWHDAVLGIQAWWSCLLTPLRRDPLSLGSWD